MPLAAEVVSKEIEMDMEWALTVIAILLGLILWAIWSLGSELVRVVANNTEGILNELVEHRARLDALVENTRPPSSSSTGDNDRDDSGND